MDALIEVLRDALLQADAADAAPAGALTEAGGRAGDGPASGRVGSGPASPVGNGSKGSSKWGTARARVVDRMQSFGT
jgi:hypothetical protein